MKKLIMCLMFLLLPMMLIGCSQVKIGVEESMSEITHTYFAGRNGDDRASISVGKREEPYKIDGIHNKELDFSLITLSLAQPKEDNTLKATLTVNGKDSEILLDLHPVYHSYMVDIGYCLKDNDEVKLTFGNKVIVFSNISKDFAINYEKALEIAQNTLIDEISDRTNNDILEGECYLQVLNEISPNFDDMFWCFTLVGKDKKVFRVIISVVDGSILAEN